MSRHTPGPLHVERAGKRIVVKAGSLIVATAAPLLIEEERIGNARLIAAAPDMLQALRKAVVLLAGACVHAPQLSPHETYEEVSAAINKATGD